MIARTRTLCLLGFFCVSHGASDNDIWAEHEAEFETPASALAVSGSNGSGGTRADHQSVRLRDLKSNVSCIS